jgi:hypothetical protein
VAATIPAPLCTLIMPNGKRCGSPALRGKRFCYFHTGKHLDFTHARRLAGRLDRLNTRLNKMSTAELLLTLRQQLETLPKTLSRFPELNCTLTNALGRLEAITTLESILHRNADHNQQFAAPRSRVAARSITYPLSEQNQQPGPKTQNRQSNQINNLDPSIRHSVSASSQPFGSA